LLKGALMLLLLNKSAIIEYHIVKENTSCFWYEFEEITIVIDALTW
jgi:hypothetical protein